ncbi:MAG TPA: plasmid pRiA4b ORF-3 family protein [Anaeromyxobacter sp.]|nr:plasmid pRiA4b ORF-3 family protein [Anaeromyxobacter sp.]
MPRTKANQIYRLEVTLAEIEPPVWRRLRVPADMTLASLHDALQDAMGWTNSHLHCFEVAGRRIGMVGVEEDSPELEDERLVRVGSVLPKKGARLLYRYDYGDDWEHVVEVEDVTARASACACASRRKAGRPSNTPHHHPHSTRFPLRSTATLPSTVRAPPRRAHRSGEAASPVREASWHA